MLPNKCIVTLLEIYIVTCGSKKKNALQDVSVASLAFHAQNFASALEKNVVQKFTNRLSWTLHMICKYKGSKPHFTIYGHNPRIYTQKFVSEKTRIFPRFTQSDVFH